MENISYDINKAAQKNGILDLQKVKRSALRELTAQGTNCIHPWIKLIKLMDLRLVFCKI